MTWLLFKSKNLLVTMYVYLRCSRWIGLAGYYREGFLTLQDAISRVLMETLSSQTNDHVDIQMQRLPYPPYNNDVFLVALQGWLPLIIMISFIYPALNIVKNVVHEKEKRLKVGPVVNAQIVLLKKKLNNNLNQIRNY